MIPPNIQQQIKEEAKKRYQHIDTGKVQRVGQSPYNWQKHIKNQNIWKEGAQWSYTQYATQLKEELENLQTKQELMMDIIADFFYEKWGDKDNEGDQQAFEIFKSGYNL